MPDVDTIIAEADDYGFSRFQTARKVSLLNRAYDKIMTRHLWPFLEITATSAAVTTGALTVPADCRSIISMVDRTNDFIIREETPEQFALRTAEHGTATAATTGHALYYHVEGGLPGGSVTLWPSNSQAVHLQYYKDHDVLTSGGAESTILIPIRHHQALSAGLLKELFLISKQYADAEAWNNIFDRYVLEMERDVFSTSIDDTDPERQLQIDRGTPQEA